MNALRCSVARPANHFYRRIARFAAMSADPKELLGYQERNRGPILDVLRGYLADIEPGMLVEVACGNGAHAAYFAPEFPHISWFPTDITEDRFPSVKAYASEVENMQKPVVLDCSRPVEDWACGSPGNTAAVLAINLLHISPWEASIGLIKGSSVLLRPKVSDFPRAASEVVCHFLACNWAKTVTSFSFEGVAPGLWTIQAGRTVHDGEQRRV